MTTPLILIVVIVSTKHLLHVYHCQQNILVEFNIHWVRVQTVLSSNTISIKNMLVLDSAKGYIRGHSTPKPTMYPLALSNANIFLTAT